MKKLCLLMVACAASSAIGPKALGPGMCRKQLRIEGVVVVGDKCRYSALRKGEGVLDYPCVGGKAVAWFDGLQLRGEVTPGGAVELKVMEAANDASACTRQGVTRIHGDFTEGLQLHFNDASITCGTKCTAHGKVTVFVTDPTRQVP